jgi:hypothetical protein
MQLSEEKRRTGVELPDVESRLAGAALRVW